MSVDVTATERMSRRLSAAKVLPVLRSPSTRDLEHAIARLVPAGFGVIELTTSTPGWAAVLRRCRADSSMSGVVFGVGTVVTVEDAARAVDAGAEFLVSPYAAPGVRECSGGVPFLEGGFSPGEVASAAALGIAKLFPASSGGIGHLKALRDVLPDARIVPTGGIELSEVSRWLAAGALAVGVGSALLRMPVGELDEAMAALR